MTLKKMASVYAYYEFQEETWNMFYQMTLHGLINRETWEKFCKKFKSVSLDESGENAVDSLTGEILYTRDPDTRMFNI